MVTDHQRLMVIQDTIDGIESLAARGKEEFDENGHVQTGIIDRLLELALASTSFTTRIKTRYPDVDWTKLDAMGSFLGYKQTSIDPEIAWLSVEQDIPAIKEEIRTIIHSVETQM